MNIPFLSGLTVSGKVNLKSLLKVDNATKILTIDASGNVSYTDSVTSNVDLTGYYTKTQCDAKYLLSSNFNWSNITGKPTKLSEFTNDSGFISSETDTLQSVTSKGNTTSDNINLNGVTKVNKQLVVPIITPVENVSGAVWLGNGSTAGIVESNQISELQDVAILNPVNGDGLIYENGQWVNNPVAEVADKNFEYTQSTPSAVWDITHNLNKMVNVTVLDSANTICQGAVEYKNKNRIVVSFNGAFTGTATLN
jgi:hypothetical protein